MTWLNNARLLAIILAACLCAPVATIAAPSAGRDAANLELEVSALQMLHELDLSADQLKELHRVAGSVKPGKPAPIPRRGEAYRAALKECRSALVENDDEKIADAQDKLDDQRDKDHVDGDPEVALSDSARAHAAEALAILTPGQVAGYLSDHSDDVPDAVQTLIDALDQVRGKSGQELASLKSEAAVQTAMLMVGLDESAQAPIIKRVSALLDEAQAMDDTQFSGKRASLEQSARQIVGRLDPIDALRHWMQREMADLLSNPRLGAALEARLKAQ